MQHWGQFAPPTEARVATPLLLTFPKHCPHPSEMLTSLGLGVCGPGRGRAGLTGRLLDRA